MATTRCALTEDAEQVYHPQKTLDEPKDHDDIRSASMAGSRGIERLPIFSQLYDSQAMDMDNTQESKTHRAKGTVDVERQRITPPRVLPRHHNRIRGIPQYHEGTSQGQNPPPESLMRISGLLQLLSTQPSSLHPPLILPPHEGQ